MTGPDPAVLAELVRLPAVLSVPGDAWTGAAWAAARSGAAPRRTAAMPVASALIYLGGMALNDWADRAVDAEERPERPIPSGRITPGAALAVGAALVTGGVGAAGALGGAGALRTASVLAAAVLTYDLAAKDTGAGPPVMAACRALDVLLGASGSGLTRALPAAAAVGTHTLALTEVSRHEVHGADPAVPTRAAAVTGALALAVAVAGTRGAGPVRTLAVAAPTAAYLASTTRGYLTAARAGGEADAVRAAVGTGVMGTIPLQSALLAGAGALGRAALTAAAIPLGRALRRRREVT